MQIQIEMLGFTATERPCRLDVFILYQMGVRLLTKTQRSLTVATEIALHPTLRRICSSYPAVQLFRVPKLRIESTNGPQRFWHKVERYRSVNLFEIST